MKKEVIRFKSLIKNGLSMPWATDCGNEMRAQKDSIAILNNKQPKPVAR